MIITARCVDTQTGILISVKNGSWFESKDERGFTHIAASVIHRLIVDACIAADIPQSSFWSRGTTNADHVRFAVFCRDSDAARMLTIVRDCLDRPSFTDAGIQEEMRIQRIDYLQSYRNRYFRAATGISRTLNERNPSVFGTARFHLRAVGPSMNVLTAYWQKLWSASARDVLLFGNGEEKYSGIVAVLSQDADVPSTCVISAQNAFSSQGRYGVSWHESCYTPLYNILDTVMINRAEAQPKGTMFSILDRGTLRTYVVTKFFGAKKKWNEVFGKDITIDEWQRAQSDWMASIERVLSGTDLYDDIFEWDDCTPAAYGNISISSLQSLAEYVEKTSYEEFIKYWNATIKAV